MTPGEFMLWVLAVVVAVLGFGIVVAIVTTSMKQIREARSAGRSAKVTAIKPPKNPG